MDIRDIVWESGDWIHTVQDRVEWQTLVNTGNELSGSIKCGEFLE
jgi:hypothetical protein